MTEKQMRFAQAYAQFANATKAAIIAGYSRRSASVTASRLLQKANVQAAVSEHKTAIAQRAELTEEFIIEGLIREALGHGGDTSSAARIRSLELLGKHRGMFIERHDVRALHAYSDPAINEVEELVNAP